MSITPSRNSKSTLSVSSVAPNSFWVSIYGLPPQWNNNNNSTPPTSCLHCGHLISSLKTKVIMDCGVSFTCFICPQCNQLNGFGTLLTNTTIEMSNVTMPSHWMYDATEYDILDVVVGEFYILAKARDKKNGNGNTVVLITKQNDVVFGRVPGLPTGNVVTMAAGGQGCYVVMNVHQKNESTSRTNVYCLGYKKDKECWIECKINIPSNVIQIAVGTSHAAFLMQDHEMYTCGSNIHQQLGGSIVSTMSTTTTGTEATTSSAPKLLSLHHIETLSGIPGSVVIDISCGSHHTAALTSMGDIYVWGTFSTNLHNETSSFNNTDNEIKQHRKVVSEILLIDNDDDDGEEDSPIEIVSTRQHVGVRTKKGRIIVLHAEYDEICRTTLDLGNGNTLLKAGIYHFGILHL